MSKRELVETHSSGLSEYAHFDSDGNLTGLQWVDDVEDVIEANKAAQNTGTKGYSLTREWQKMASIPVAVLMQYCQEKNYPLQYALGGKEQTEIILRMLKDPDYRYLRTDI